MSSLKFNSTVANQNGRVSSGNLLRFILPIVMLLFCAFSLSAQENVTGGKVANTIEANSVKPVQEFWVGGKNCPGCNGKIPSALVLVDGLEVSGFIFDLLAPENIQDLSVIKDDRAIEMYGTRGANGVVSITTNLSKRGLKKVMKKMKQQQQAIDCQHKKAV